MTRFIGPQRLNLIGVKVLEIPNAGAGVKYDLPHTPSSPISPLSFTLDSPYTPPPYGSHRWLAEEGTNIYAP